MVGLVFTVLSASPILVLFIISVKFMELPKSRLVIKGIEMKEKLLSAAFRLFSFPINLTSKVAIKTKVSGCCWSFCFSIFRFRWRQYNVTGEDYQACMMQLDQQRSHVSTSDATVHYVFISIKSNLFDFLMKSLQAG